MFVLLPAMLTCEAALALTPSPGTRIQTPVLCWSFGGDIQRVYPDGTQAGPTIGTSGYGRIGFAVAPGHSRAYLSANNDLAIQVAPLDGVPGHYSSLCYETLIDIGTPYGQGEIPSIAIDVTRRKLYWLRGATGVNNGWSLNRADLFDGSNVEPLLTQMDTASALTIDSANERLFWAEKDNDQPARIRYSDLDGAGAGDLLSGLTTLPTGLALDPTEQKLYWCDGTHVYRRSAQPGSSSVEIPIFNAEAVAIAIDVASRTLYWAKSRSFHRATLDGQNQLLLFSTSPGISVQWFALDVTAPVPVAPSCRRGVDADFDRDVDLQDFAVWQNCLTGPGE